MKRSEINSAIEYVKRVLKEKNFPLPSFAYYTIDQWKNIKEDEIEIVENMLGWDVTDFGSGDFWKMGLTVFTFRNGNFHAKKKYPKNYAEKLLYVMDGQVLPFHYHWYKREDIINRGGGDLEITMYNASKRDFQGNQAEARAIPGEFDENLMEIVMDGKRATVPAGSKVILKPGQSIAISPGQYHQWRGIPGTGDVMLFEVSATNDDFIDNRFYIPQSRIPQVEEDEAPRHLMFADYPNYTKFNFLK